MAAGHFADPIEHPRVLAVEGTHEVHLSRALLSAPDMRDLPAIDVQPLGGKTSLRDRLTALLQDPRLLDFYDNGEAIAIGIVRDADDNPDGALQSVTDALKHSGLPVPQSEAGTAVGDVRTPQGLSLEAVRVSVFIMPGGGRTGSLEDLCIETVRCEPAYECVEGLFECLQARGLAGPPAHRMGKARAHAFLATRAEPDKHVGLGAREGYWPFGHEAFAPLKAFLRSM